MNALKRFSSDIAFTEKVKALQQRKGSRKTYERVEQGGSWETVISEELRAFIGRQRSFFLATSNAENQPYIQHRGGPPGFLRVLDEHTLGFADFSGNRQYISLGNLAENPKVHLFLIDYTQRQRIKIWGEAQVVSDDPALLLSLTPKDYRGRPEQAIVIKIAAWDANCPQHIPQRFEAEDIQAALRERDQRIAELEGELQRLKKRSGD
jgi:predicted pyridoxine 5'-phosphate oxidase superfamily flavin-nucleotide-binding protein